MTTSARLAKLKARFRMRRQVPVLLQMNATECGAACLAMVLGYHGKRVQVAECAKEFGVGRDGVSARSIMQTARRYSLDPKAYAVEARQFAQVALPAIVFWNNNHFVVVERWSPRDVEIVDPADGRRTLEQEQFQRHFSKVALTFQPDRQFQRSPRFDAFWRGYLLQMLRVPRVKRLVVQALAASVLLQVFSLVLPLFTKVLVDQLLPLIRFDLINIVGVGVLIVLLAQLLTTYVRALVLMYIQEKIDSSMMGTVIAHVLRLPFAFFQQKNSGDIIARLSGVAFVREILINQSISIFFDGLLLPVYLIILFVQAPLFGLIVLLIGLVQVLVLISSNASFYVLTQRYLMYQADHQSFAIQTIKGIGTIKASGYEDFIRAYWQNLFLRELGASLQRSRLNALISTLLASLRGAAPFVVLWAGSWQVAAGSMSLGDLLALNIIAGAVLAPLATLVAAGQQLQFVKAHLQRVRDLVEAPAEQPVPPPGPQAASAQPGRIDLRDVGFCYPGSLQPVLSNISLAIEPGQKVALVGPTGSGKSTLAMLLLGLFLPTQGELCYQGTPIEQLDYRQLRHQYGVVLQEVLLFSGSIRQNLTLNNPDISLEQVIQAAQIACIHDEIMAMPMRYETWLGEGGAGLSGGQRQRLALARALVHRPAVLLLDEATSHLDVATEAQVDLHLGQLACTRIVIAHRLSTVQSADLIVVLERGRIVERGTHTELLARRGAYAQLISRQLDGAFGAGPGA